MWASTPTAPPPSRPTAASPRPSVCVSRPRATSSTSPSAVPPPEVVTVTVPPSWATLSAVSPVRMSTPSSASASVTCAHANSSSRESRRRSPSISVTRLPSVWNACAISTPTTPPPMITSRPGIAFAVVASRFVHAPSMASRPSMGGMAGGAPPARVNPRRAPGPPPPPRAPPPPAHLPPPPAGGPRRPPRAPSPPPLPPPLAGQLPPAADEDDAAVVEPRQLRRVVEVVDHLVAALEHGRHVERAAERLPRARHAPRLGQRLVRAQERLRRHAGPVGALAAHEPILDEGDLEPVLREAAGRHLPRRPGADHHDIEAAHAPHPTRGPEPFRRL